MRILFIFLDGVGLGTDDQSINPFAFAKTPNLDNLFGGRKLLAESVPFESDQASLLALDAGSGGSRLCLNLQPDRLPC